MNDRDRDKFYSAPDAGNDDEEYEVEPPDAEVLAAEERRGKDAIEASRESIDIDEIYREASRDRGSEIVENWLRNFRFRFQIKHLLIATAVVAIAMTLAKFGSLGSTIVILVMLSVASVYVYLQWQESMQQREAARRREEIYARCRAHFERKAGNTSNDPTPVSVGPPPASNVAPPAPKTSPQPQLRFQFSLKQLIITMTTAAVVLCAVRLLGGPSNTATLLGFVALLGLVIHALGFNPPEIAVLGWWLILVLYVLLNVFAAIWKSFA